MLPEFEVCNRTRSTITEEPFSRYSENPLLYSCKVVTYKFYCEFKTFKNFHGSKTSTFICFRCFIINYFFKYNLGL